MAQPITARGFVFEYLKDGSTRDMAVNGSITPVTYSYAALEYDVVISRANVTIIDDAPFSATSFGGGTALTNGLSFFVKDSNDALLQDFMAGAPIVKNADWGALAGVDWTQVIGAGLDAITVRWSLFKSGQELLLRQGDVFECTVNDDLTGQTEINVMLQGYRA